MEHHLSRDWGRLQQIHNEPQSEVTPETDVVCATSLAERRLSMEGGIHLRKHKTSMQMGHTMGYI